jgi:putative thioredoxin
VGPLPDDDKQTLEAAAQALTDGDGTQAATLFGAILARDPGHVQATGGLVRALVLIGDLEKARTMLAELSPEVLRSPALVAARTALDLADQAVALGDTADLHRKIAQNGDDHQARLDLALALNAKGQRSEAAALLLEIIRRDRAWNDGAARTQLLQLFEAWGVMDPHTVAARKTLSTLIFS